MFRKSSGVAVRRAFFGFAVPVDAASSDLADTVKDRNRDAVRAILDKDVDANEAPK